MLIIKIKTELINFIFLSITPFDGTKYSVWKYRVSLLLDEENVGFVIEDAVPEKPDLIWAKSEKVAKRILIENMDDSMLTFFKKSDSAREIIKKFDDLYERESLTTQLTIEKNLLSLKYNEDMPLIKHFMIFEQMLQDVTAAGSIINERNKIARLLITLPKSYDSIVTAIQTTLPENLNLSLVKTNLLEYESKLNNERKDTSNKVLQINTSAPYNNPTSNYRFKKYKQYNNNKNKNNKSYNSNNKYYNKYKYSKQPYKQINTYGQHNKTFNKKYPKCIYCGRTNHQTEDCYYKQHTDKNNEASQLQTAIAGENSDSFAFMSDAQNKLIQKDLKNNKITFLLDSGATDHVINRDDVFSQTEILSEPIIIKVAKKDASITATKRGNIQVVTNCGVAGILKDVLYAPELQYNLLSVRRMQQSGMRVTFMENGSVNITKNNKVMATCKSTQNLVSVELKLNTYFLNQIEVNKNSYKLWHARLGHPEKNKFLKMKTKDMFLNNNKISDVYPVDDVCEACIYGKQTRLLN